MFSQGAEYALRCAVCVAEHGPDALTIERIAQLTRVPEPYLRKIVTALVRADVLVAQRGPMGGVRLARTPDEVTLLDVVNAVDPVERLNGCPLHRPEHAHALCALHSHIDRAAAQVQAALDTPISGLLTGTPVLFPERRAQARIRSTRESARGATAGTGGASGTGGTGGAGGPNHGAITNRSSKRRSNS